MTKKCLFCAEEIQDEAIKCRFCGEFLKPQPKIKWYLKTATIVTGFLMVGPLVLPLVWINPQYSTKKKLVITAIMLVISYVAFQAISNALTTIKESYKPLMDMMSK